MQEEVILKPHCADCLQDIQGCRCTSVALSNLENKCKIEWEMNYKSVDNISKRCIVIENEMQKLKNFLHSEVKEINHDMDSWVEMRKEMGKRLDSFEERMKQINKNMLERKPYKCPVCDGQGIKKVSELSINPVRMMTHEAPCIACEQKGIVWG